MSMNRVPGDDEIYIGGIFSLSRAGALKKLGITHIVSVLIYDFKNVQDWEQYKHLNIGVNDVEDENLLEHFPQSNTFIGDALAEGGKVFIHCAMGKSRSVTIALAYLLATRSQLDLESALELIRESRPMAEPNEGFMTQLALYKSMQCPQNVEAQPAYQRWLYARDVELSVAVGRAPDRLRFEDEENRNSIPDSTTISPDSGKLNKELRCKRCRTALATSQYIIPHSSKKESASAKIDYSPISTLPQPRHDIAPSSLPSDCTHHFVQPLSWMREVLERSELSGKLDCPNKKCNALVGKYAWQGLKCSCGEWVVPGLSLHSARVDEIVKDQSRVKGASLAGGTGIRMPPGMSMPSSNATSRGNL